MQPGFVPIEECYAFDLMYKSSAACFRLPCCTICRLQAHAGTEGSQAIMDWMVTRDVGLNNRSAVTDAEVKDAIRTYIADPEFHRYVDRMEQLWESVEEEMLQQVEYEGMEVT